MSGTFQIHFDTGLVVTSDGDAVLLCTSPKVGVEIFRGAMIDGAIAIFMVA